MKFLPLVWKNLWRRKVRTIFTLLSVAAAFLLFGYLQAINHAFQVGVDLTGNDRLILIHKVSLIRLLPESYEGRIEAVDGVVDATHLTWFGGYYQDPIMGQFPQMPVEIDEFLDMYPEYQIDGTERAKWEETRVGAIVGRKLAEKYEWSVGDRVPIQGTIWSQADGNRTWEFEIAGIYEGAEKGTDETQMFFRYDYFDEARPEGIRGNVGWYMIRVADPDRSAEVAGAVDALFANSPAETKTSTEKAFMQGFAKQMGDLGAIITAVVAAMFFTILLVTGNTMAQSIRERTGELAVLKTLGLTGGRILGLVLTESMLLSVVGGLAGLGVAWAAITAIGDPTGMVFPVFYLPSRGIVQGLIWILVLGVVSGALPALQASRMKIVDALRKV